MIHRHPMPYEVLYTLRCYCTKCVYTCAVADINIATDFEYVTLSLSALTDGRRHRWEHQTTYFVSYSYRRTEIIQLSMNTVARATIWHTIETRHKHTHRHTQAPAMFTKTKRAHVQLGDTHMHCTLWQPKVFVNVSRNDSSANVLIGLNHEQIVCLHFRCAGNETNGISCVFGVWCVKWFGRVDDVCRGKWVVVASNSSSRDHNTARYVWMFGLTSELHILFGIICLLLMHVFRF